MPVSVVRPDQVTPQLQENITIVLRGTQPYQDLPHHNRIDAAYLKAASDISVMYFGIKVRVGDGRYLVVIDPWRHDWWIQDGKGKSHHLCHNVVDPVEAVAVCIEACVPKPITESATVNLLLPDAMVFPEELRFGLLKRLGRLSRTVHFKPKQGEDPRPPKQRDFVLNIKAIGDWPK